MIGLMFFQLYWINGLITANKEQFKKDVLNALNNVASKLERQETIKAFNKLNYLNSQGFDKSKKNHNKLQIRKYQSQKIHYHKKNDSLFFLDTFPIGYDVEFIVNFSGFGAGFGSGIFKEYPFNDDNSIKEMLEKKNYKIRELEERLDRISKKYKQTFNVARSLVFPVRKLTERYNSKELDSLVDMELKNKGINIDYRYGVFATSSKKLVSTNAHQHLEDLKKSELKATLFPNDVLGSSAQLLISFPNKKKYLLNKIWLALTSSAILALVILFCFGYSIRTIVKQKKLSEMKTDFVNNMTHELKTPISTVSLAVEALLDKEIDGSMVMLRQKYLNLIHEENQRLGNQVEKVLQIAVIEKNKYTLEKEIISMNKIIEKAKYHISVQVEKRQGSIRFIKTTDNDLVFADKIHMTNVIHNLLDNANKYSPESPNIIIRSEIKQDLLVLSIQDKGLGMTKEQQKHIFEKFYRVPTGNRHDVKGFGLGLAYVQHMIYSHNGKITVNSEIGKGSNFSISIPLYHET